MQVHTLAAMMLVSLVGFGAKPSRLGFSATSLGDPPRITRVRSPDAAIAAVIRDAPAWSSTLRSLLATIDASDGLVFIEDGPCGHSVHACLALSVKIAGPSRLLRIRVDARRSYCQLSLDIGHELQHAIEILANPGVRDWHTAYSLFQRIGRTGSERFETRAALQVGDQIEDECRARDR